MLIYYYYYYYKKQTKNTVILKDFNPFMYHHVLYHERKHFCRHCLLDFSTEGIFKCHIALEKMGNKIIRCRKR